MRLRRVLILCCAPLLFVEAATGQQQTETAPSAAQPAVEVETADKAQLDEGVAFLLLESLALRTKLRDQPAQSSAGRLWKSTSRYGALVQAADPAHAPQFLPIIDGFRRSLRDAAAEPGGIDEKRLDGLVEALNDQIEIYESPGVFEGGRGDIEVEIHALRNGQANQPVNGLYVALDLSGSVPIGASANTLNRVTSPATGTVGPGKYLIRLMSGNTVVARRTDVRIGRTGNKERIDVVVP